VTHLTEADQELSDDFDENKNTVRQPNKKKSRMVKPSDMLGIKSLTKAKLIKNTDEKSNSSKLSVLLNKRD